mmetsp:Transcript_8211/g.24147  ORF Transcript_8211/g.24147 Transcript_8211/m.24147 type:complete len:267 (+) Transcript_8211:1829-2629(+)
MTSTSYKIGAFDACLSPEVDVACKIPSIVRLSRLEKHGVKAAVIALIITRSVRKVAIKKPSSPLPSPDNARTAIFRTSREACECVSGADDVVKKSCNATASPPEAFADNFRATRTEAFEVISNVRSSQRRALLPPFCSCKSLTNSSNTRLDILDPDATIGHMHLTTAAFFSSVAQRKKTVNRPHPLGGPNVKSTTCGRIGVEEECSFIGSIFQICSGAEQLFVKFTILKYPSLVKSAMDSSGLPGQNFADKTVVLGALSKYFGKIS